MKAEELRIGNLVNCIYVPYGELKGSEYCKVSLSVLKSIIVPDNDFSFKYNPIPLTPEILEKCGFKNVRDDYWIIINELLIAKDSGWWWTNSWEASEEFEFENLASYREIKYLHELQNLFFAIFKTELPLTFNQTKTD